MQIVKYDDTTINKNQTILSHKYLTSNVTTITEVWKASFGLVLHAQHIFANSVCRYVVPPGECYYNILLGCEDYISLPSVVSHFLSRRYACIWSSGIIRIP